jgi:hypothetical protein
MDNTNERIARALLPTHKELRRRKNIFIQFGLFTRTSWAMWRLARRSH